MYNELQVLLSLLSSLAAVVHLNYAFCDATTAYMHRSQAIIQAICKNVTNLIADNLLPVYNGT